MEVVGMRVCCVNIYMEDKPVMRSPKSCCDENDIQSTCCTEGRDVIVVQVESRENRIV